MLFDVAAAALSFVLALGIRFDAPSAQFDSYLAAFSWLVPLLVAVRVIVFVLFSLYQRVWRYASIDELLSVVGGSLVSSALAYGLVFALLLVNAVPLQSFPRSIPLLDTMIFIVLAGLWRFSFRVIGVARRDAVAGGVGERALVVGSGLVAIAVVRELRHGTQSLPFIPVGVLADDLQARQRLMGLPVLGRMDDLAQIIRAHRIQVVLLALPSADGRTLRRFVRISEAGGARCLTVPSFAEVAAGRVTIDALRQIDVEDLLRRAPARIDLATVSASFRDTAVLITGAGGSIGGELARQILTLQPDHLILVGRGENSIFETMQSLVPLRRDGQPRITPVILDIRDERRLFRLLAELKPDIVFHAAAHKHVGFMEQFPEEAVATNVLGTQGLLRACAEQGVSRFILISTDKAVNPTSVMGASKRVAELLVQSTARRTGLAYASVRFGNVLSSRGSVVPIFRQQLARGGPLLVTDPEVSRYFMTIPEAVQLVLQAAAFARPADTFILDMGEPVKIADLARDLVELHGLEAGRDIDIQFIGLRPGEKLTEELVFPDEQLEPTDHEAILRVRDAARQPSLDDDMLAGLRTAASELDRRSIVRSLRELVPQYQPSELHATR